MTTQSKTETQQHTPGPWNRCQYGYLFAMVPGEAFGHPALVSRQICNVQQTENQADVRLIAAAPDMLEALTYCLGHLERETTIAGQSMRQHIRAAIAKATGAQS